MSGRPLDVLEAAIGDEVTVRLKDGEEFVGALTGYDQHMNIVLEQTDDETGETDETDGPTLGDLERREIEDTMIIRGDNVVSITP